ncbi:3490_t:CDS:10, partial [Paraglomus brasilianum]
MTSPRSPILTPWSPVLGPMPAIIEDYLSDQNLGPHTSQSLYSPRKAKPTTQLSLEVPASNKYSSSAASSVKSSNGISTKIDVASETEEEVLKEREGGSVDEILINLMNRSSGGSSSGKGKGIDILNGEEQLYFTAEPESETLHEGVFYGNNVDKGADSDSSCELTSGLLTSTPDGTISRDLSVVSMDDEYSGYRRKYSHEDPQSAKWARHRKHFFILSSAGKPIYTRYGDESRISPYMGVVQAIVSFFADGDDSIKCINAGRHKLVFLLKAPLYLVAVSRTNESESQLRNQLSYLYNQIIYVVTSAHLTKVFEQRTNFDLRRLIAGTEVFLDNLSSTMGDDLGFLFGSIECMRMNKELREKVATVVQSIKRKELLYAMLMTDNKLITLLRPRKHSLHPSDLHLIFNMVNGSSAFQAVESWIPLCLPKFNSKGFLHAYVSYITSNVCLLLVSPDKGMFFELAEAKSVVVEKLTLDGTLTFVEEIARNDGYAIADIGAPALRHFLYKSKPHVQHTMPMFTPPYDNPRERR